MGRLVNWESILAKKIEEARHIKFEYGVNDCTTWSYKVITSYTDYITWTPYWKNKKEALKAMKVPMEKQVTRALGRPPRTNILYTKRGDLVQRGIGSRATLGICIGSKVVFLYKGKGICYYDLTDCTYSWEI